MEIIDFDKINANAANAIPGLVSHWLPGGVRKGKEWVSTNPNRASDERPGSFSVNIHNGKWADFAADEKGGDIISLCAYLFHNGDQGAAARQVAKEINMLPEVKTAPPAKSKTKWVPVLPVPDDAPARPTVHYHYGTPARIWTYTDADGRILGQVWRFDTLDQKTGKPKKEIIPLVLCHAEGNPARRSWQFRQFPEPRPLYGLDRLAAKPGAPVLIVEGEKCADAAAAVLSVPVITWPGGGNAWKKADWSAVAGRRVLLWPDADPAGYKTIEGETDKPGLAHHLQALGCEVKIIEPPARHVEAADKWDVADALAPKDGSAGWTATQLITYVKDPQNKRAPRALPEPEARTKPAAEPIPAASQQDAPPEFDAAEYLGDAAPRTVDRDYPFLFLGFDHGEYFYLGSEGQQVIRLAAAEHTERNLYTLAPLTFWRLAFPPMTKSAAFNTSEAANALMSRNHEAGPYDADRLRGRGAWFDNKRVVLHLGDQLILDNRPIPINKIESRYVYERAVPMRADIGNPLNNQDAERLLELCNLLSWEKPVYGDLLAGWLAIASICGAMQWRPHLWLTGPAGSGKSWVYDNVLKKIIEDFALQVLGETTEAYVRQTLGRDARPVVFDEIEGNTREDQTRIQKILGLMRVSSSETGGKIGKGGATGKATGYIIRSMFALCSIGVGLEQYADKTRVTVLSLIENKRPTKEREFEDICKLAADTLTPDYIQRFHARMIQLIPVIRENARTFARAAAAEIGKQRLGDQAGALLAGAYALRSSSIISLEDARAYVDNLDWTNEKALSEQADEMLCLSAIMEQTTRVQLLNGAAEQSFGELVEIAAGRLIDMNIQSVYADEHLKRYGIKVTDDKTAVVISNTSKKIAGLLQNTPWGKNWGRTLKRLPDVEEITPIRFAPGTPKARGVKIPIAILSS